MAPKRFPVLAALLVILTALLAGGPKPALAQQPLGPHGQPEPPMLGVHWAKGQSPTGNTSPLQYHGGPIVNSSTAVQPVYWGSSWPTTTSDKTSGIKFFYDNVGTTAVGGTDYWGTNTEYTNGGGNHVSALVTDTAGVTDGSAAPSSAPSTSTVLAEVQKEVTNGNITPATNGYYPVYSDQKRGTAGYCAWHSWGTVTTPSGSSVTIQFGFFFNLDNDSGCDVSGTANAYSIGTQSLVNVSGHEISEVATDAQGSAWYDRRGYENADKCAWTFSGTVNVGNVQWQIQRNWSNNANGCIQTGYIY